MPVFRDTIRFKAHLFYLAELRLSMHVGKYTAHISCFRIGPTRSWANDQGVRGGVVVVTFDGKRVYGVLEFLASERGWNGRVGLLVRLRL